MKEHAKKHPNQSILCPKCPITFKTIVNIISTIEVVMPSSTYKRKCGDCKKILFKKKKKDMAITAKIAKFKK